MSDSATELQQLVDVLPQYEDQIRYWESQLDAISNVRADIVQAQETLNGMLDSAEPAAPSTRAVIGPPIGTPNLGNGRQLYAQACVACHGEDGQAGHVAPPITPGLSLGAVVRIIAEGGAEMPGFTGTFTSRQARDIAGFVTQDLMP